MSERAYAARVTVRLSDGVNDPQGNTVRDGLRAIGYESVRGVRVGKVVDLVVDASSVEEATATVEKMCRAMLANPVIETFEVSITEAGEA
jgi:phosphoribosylformylglycinamidine synthase PurS subunit